MSDKSHLDSWRIFRIVSEFVDGFETMTNIGPSVSIFGSSRASEDSDDYKLATIIAEKIARRGFGIITGGGPGIMEAANKGAQIAKGISCGISINLPFEEKGNHHIDERYKLNFRYFFVRKVMFIRYAQAFVFLPGGFGTLDELFEALTLIQTKKIKKFPLFLVGTNYWTGMMRWLKEFPLKHKCLTNEDLDFCTITDDPDEIVNKIEQHYHLVGKTHTFDLGHEDD